nr:hypothetical protein [Gemmatimonadota bacterium]
ALERGDPRAARDWLSRAAEVEPANAELRERLETVHAPGEARDTPPSAVTETPLESGPPTAATQGGGVPRTDGADRTEEIATVTLAEIYAEQGLHERALDVYRRILENEPSNALVHRKIEQLEGALEAERAEVDARSGADLAGFLPSVPSVLGGELAGRVARSAPAPNASALERQFGSPGQRATAPAEPWAFLLQDEPDNDPEQVFGGARFGAASDLAGDREEKLDWLPPSRHGTAPPIAQEFTSLASTAPPVPAFEPGQYADASASLASQPPAGAEPRGEVLTPAAEQAPAAKAEEPRGVPEPVAAEGPPLVPETVAPAEPPPPSGAQETPPGQPQAPQRTLVEEEDLRKFQEWLRSLK